MDEASDTPRSWGRWLLLGQAARFAVVGGYSSVRDWASTEPRDRADLDRGATAQVRNQLLEKFTEWWKNEEV